MTAAYASNVLENALQRLSYDARESAFARCDDILAEFSTWPFGQTTSSVAGPVAIGGGKRGGNRDGVQELVREVRKEMGEEEDSCFEVVATVLEIFGRMDTLVSDTSVMFTRLMADLTMHHIRSYNY